MRVGLKAIPLSVLVVLACIVGFGHGCQTDPLVMEAVENAEQTNGPPTGYREVTALVAEQTGWVDPASPLIKWLGDAHLLEIDSPVQPGERTFVLFDELGVIALTLAYSPSENTIYYDAPSENPIWGRTPTQVDDGWEYRIQMASSTEGVIHASVVFVVTCVDGDEAQSGTFSLQLSEVFTAAQDLPAVPEEGKEAVPTGTTATWIDSTTLWLEPSQSPFGLFPGAQIVPAPEE